MHKLHAAHSAIIQGMIWFWVPVALVIMNDVAAYVCGMMFGRHQLIKLSPKKTVEGFVGAFFVTIVFAVLVSRRVLLPNEGPALTRTIANHSGAPFRCAIST